MAHKMPEYRVRLARDLRQRRTESEQHLWQYLRGGRLNGLKFRRQRPIDRYIADFCCDAIKLIVEIDGGIHNKEDNQEYDAIRDDVLAAHGYTILRVSADDVMVHTPQMLIRIGEAATKIANNFPSLLAGEGPGVRG